MAEIVQLDIKAGTTFERSITLTDDTGRNPVNIENFTFVGRVKENYDTDNITATFTVEKLQPFTLGTVMITLSADTTRQFNQRKYVFDIAYTRDTFPETTDTLLEGYLIVRRTTLE